MPTIRLENHETSQNGWSPTITGTYTAGTNNNNVSFAYNQTIWIRFPHQLPKNATINSATLRLVGGVKTASTTQHANHYVFGRNVGNHPRLVNGQAVVTSTSGTFASTNVYITTSHTANATGPWSNNVNVTAIVQELANRSDFQPGGYMVFAIRCHEEPSGSDMNFNFVGNFNERYSLTIDYTENSTLTKWDVNQLRNSSFASNTDGWGFTDGFGAFEIAGASLTRDTSFKRVASQVASLRFNAPAPSGTKQTGFTMLAEGIPGSSQVFCGWIYVPSTLNAEVYAEFLYYGGPTRTTITARNQWVPFCTRPWDWNTETATGRWLFIGIGQGYQQGQNVWLSEPTMMYSKAQEYPFNTYTPNSLFFTHTATESVSSGQVVRSHDPRRQYRSTSGMSLARSYRLDSNGLWSPTVNTML